MSGAGTANLDITALAQGWLDGSTPVPSVILSPYATAGSEALFYKQASGANGPSLLLYWMPRLGEPRGATVESTPLTDRMSLGVNVANGNLMVQNNDLHIAGNGIDETVDRTWNSLDPGFDVGNYGLGWSSNAGGNLPRLFAYTSDGLTLEGPDGSMTFWPNDPSNAGNYLQPAGIDASLCSTTLASCSSKLISGATYALTLRSGERWEFNGSGFRVADIDPNGNQITYTRNGQQQLTSLTDTQGRQTTFAPNGAGFGQVTGMQDVAGARSTSYTYGTNSVLNTYVDAAGKTTTYGWGTGTQYVTNLLTQITDPDGEVTKLAYDAIGRVTSFTRVTNNTTGAGDTTTYTYYSRTNAPISCTPPPRRPTAADLAGTGKPSRPIPTATRRPIATTRTTACSPQLIRTATAATRHMISTTTSSRPPSRQERRSARPSMTAIERTARAIR